MVSTIRVANGEEWLLCGIAGARAASASVRFNDVDVVSESFEIEMRFGIL